MRLRLYSCKKKVVLVLMIILCFTILSTKAEKGNAIQIECYAGYQDKVILGNTNPFTVVVTTNHNSSIKNGELQVVLPMNNMYDEAHTIPFELSPNSTKEFKLDLLCNTAITKYNVIILEANKEIAQKEFEFDEMIDPNKPIIGVLTDSNHAAMSLNKINLEEFNKVTIDINDPYYYERMREKNQFAENLTQAIYLHSENIPNNSNSFNSFDMLVVEDFDFNSLNIEQKNAMKKWLDNGGTVVVATGPKWRKAEDVLKFLNSSIILNGVKNVQIDDGMLVKNEKSPIGDTPLSNVLSGDFIVKRGTFEKPLIVEEKIKKGKLNILTFSLKLEPFVSWNLKNKLWSELIKEGVNSNFETELRIINSNFDNYNIPTILNDDTRGMLRAILYSIIIYIIIVGPFAYIFLKRKDKRDLSWIVIPCVSLIFLFIVNLFGVQSGYKKAFQQNSTNIEIDNDSKEAKVFSVIQVFNNKKGDMKISYESKEDKQKFTMDNNNYHNGYFNPNNPEVHEKKLYAKYTYSDVPEDIFKNIGLWSNKRLRYTNNMTLESTVESELYLDNGKMIGKISNGTKMALKEAFMYIGNYFIYIGDILPDETIEVDAEFNSEKVSRNLNDFLYNIYGKKIEDKQNTINPNMGYPQSYQTIHGYSMQQQNFNIKQLKTLEDINYKFYYDTSKSIINDINYVFNNSSNLKPLLIAFNDDSVTKPIVINGEKSNALNYNKISCLLDLKVSNNKIITIPEGIIMPFFNGESIQRHDVLFYKNLNTTNTNTTPLPNNNSNQNIINSKHLNPNALDGPVIRLGEDNEFIFTINSKIVAKDFRIFFEGKHKSSGVSTNTIKKILNVKTNIWEEITLEEGSVFDTNILNLKAYDYIGEYGEIKISIDLLNDEISEGKLTFTNNTEFNVFPMIEVTCIGSESSKTKLGELVEDDKKFFE